MHEQRNPKRLPTGISERHSRSCGTHDDGGGKCTCSPSIRAFVYDRRTGTKVRKSFTGKGAAAAAKRWRADVTSQMNAGKNIVGSRRTLRDAAEAWLDGAHATPPTVLNRSGRPYKPSALRGYEQDLRNHVLDDLGAHRLSDVRRADLQAMVTRLLARGLSGSKVRNVLVPVQVIFRHAIENDEVSVNPTANLRLPKGSEPRQRAATASEAAELIAALPLDLQPLFATACYAGLRRGELMALRWEQLDLATGLIRVTRAWDERAGEIAPKSTKGRRTVPLTALLRDHLTDHKARTGRDGMQFVFGQKPTNPFTPSYVRRRSHAAWQAENVERAIPTLAALAHGRTEDDVRVAADAYVRFRVDATDATDANGKTWEAAARAIGVTPRSVPTVALLDPIGLHELRHTYVSLMHDAGLSLERIGDYVGHTSAYMTERYRHLLAGHEAEAAKLLDAYLARADTASRVEQLA